MMALACADDGIGIGVMGRQSQQLVVIAGRMAQIQVEPLAIGVKTVRHQSSPLHAKGQGHRHQLF